MDCLFCKIINGEIPSKTVYEDELVKVFLDINPSTNGDMLIVPKKHYENVYDLDEALVPHIHKLIKKLYDLVKEKLGAEGLTIAQNNGHGQEIKHYHVHVTPRYSNDGILVNKNTDSLKDLDEILNKLTK